MCDSTVGLVLPGRNALRTDERMSGNGSSSRAASGLDTESDFICSVYSAVKIVVTPPIPIASMIMTTEDKPGRFTSPRAS